MVQSGRAKRKLKPEKQNHKTSLFAPSSSLSPPPPAAARARPWRASCRVPSRSPRARTSTSRRPSAPRRRSSRTFPRRRPRPRCSPGGGSRPPPSPCAPFRLSQDSSLAYAAYEGGGAGRRRRSGRSRRTLRPRPRPLPRPRRPRSSSAPASASKRTCPTISKCWYTFHLVKLPCIFAQHKIV
jgi:hypothetical protein